MFLSATARIIRCLNGLICVSRRLLLRLLPALQAAERPLLSICCLDCTARFGKGILLWTAEVWRIFIRYDLRSVIAIATQQPALFNASIAENISCILGQVNEEAVFSSARTAALHEYILSLPRGYETMIGDDGCRLSQGIKQRIAIARAVYRKPSILILDEATSSIDTRTEEKIFAALREERQGLSTLVVSHRLSSIRGAERIFFIKDGCLAAEGAHEKMLLNERAYAEFFHYQLMKENYETK